MKEGGLTDKMRLLPDDNSFRTAKHTQQEHNGSIEKGVTISFQGNGSPKSILVPGRNHKDTTTTNMPSARKSDFFKLPKRKLIILGYSTFGKFFINAAVGMFNPIFPLEAIDKQIGNFWVKFTFGVFYLVVFITSPVFGRYLSKLGPNFVNVTSLYVAGMVNLFFAVIHYGPGNTSYLVLVIVLRCLSAVSRSGYSTLTQALVFYEFQDNMGLAQSILQGGSTCGFIIGPALSGFLYDVGGYTLPFYIIGGVILFLAIVTHFTLPNIDHSIPTLNTTDEHNDISLFGLLKSPLFIVALFSVFSGAVGVNNLDSTLTEVLLPLGLSLSMVGLVFLQFDVFNIIGSFFWSYLADTLNREGTAILMGLFGSFVGYVLLGPATFLPFIPHTVATICVAVGIIGAAYGGVLTPVMKCLLVAKNELGYREDDFDVLSTISGLFNSLMTLGGFFGQFVLGLIGNSYGDGTMFTVIALINLFTFVVASILFTARRKGNKEN